MFGHDDPGRPARQMRKKIAEEIERLHDLPDRFLARALRDIGRQARADLGSPYNSPQDHGYGNLILWTIIPALAANLGEKGLDPDERAGIGLLPEDRVEMRRFVGTCFNNDEIGHQAARSKASFAVLLVSRSFVNGNPVILALDRVAPPAPGDRDWIARHMREISKARFGHDGHDRWTPAFNAYEGSKISTSGAAWAAQNRAKRALAAVLDEIEEVPDPEI